MIKYFTLTTILITSIFLYMIFWHSPLEINQGYVQKIMYLHVPAIFTAYLAIFGVFICSVAYLWQPKEVYDNIAVVCAELGALFCLISLVTGAIWGKPTWNTYWTWDARITFTLILFLIFTGYSILRYLTEEPQIAKAAAIIGICGFFAVPLNHLAVKWWRTLHQPSSIFSERQTMSPEIKYFLLFSFAYFLLLLAYLFLIRIKLEKGKRSWKKQLAFITQNAA